LAHGQHTYCSNFSPDTILLESPAHERLKTHSEEKRRIGAIAATLINDGGES